jgi:hypothetical protein
MAEEYSIVCVVVCDDARKEDNGKDLLIGVYGDMRFSQIPALLPILGLHFQVRIKKMRFDNVKVSIKGPDGESVVDINGVLEFGSTTHIATFNFRFGPVQFMKTGDYEVYLGMDEEPSLVRTFNISTPEPTAQKD